jgi:hypothetical protein
MRMECTSNAAAGSGWPTPLGPGLSGSAGLDAGDGGSGKILIVRFIAGSSALPRKRPSQLQDSQTKVFPLPHETRRGSLV